MSSSSPKKSLGRQKVEMKKMTNENNLQVTFSKRRTGLFKKASELCTLCNADVALIVFSPGDKVYSFGHPNADDVLDRFLNGAPPPQESATNHLIDAQQRNNVRELNVQLTHLTNRLETARKRGDDLAALNKAAQAQFWWAKPIEEMSLAQLEEYKDALQGLQKQVNTFSDKALLETAAKPAQFFTGASSSANLVHLAQPGPQVFPPQLIQPPVFGKFLPGGGTMMSDRGLNNVGARGFGSADSHGLE